MTSKTKCAVLILILFGALPVLAHTGHKKKPQTRTTVTAPSNAQTQNAPQQQPEQPVTSAEVTVERDVKTMMREAAMAHFHNKLIHFPLALGLTASILIFFARKKPEMLSAIRILLLIAAIFSVAAYFTGKAQEEPFEEGEMHELLEWHQWLGTASGICLWTGVFLTGFSRVRNWLWAYAVIQVLLLACTGFLGGVLAHG